MALGRQLRNARINKRLTTSQVAALTKIKIQTIEAIENEEFNKLPVSIYGKGFIRIFAEQVGVDPAPLVREYLEALNGPPSSAGATAPRARRETARKRKKPAKKSRSRRKERPAAGVSLTRVEDDSAQETVNSSARKDAREKTTDGRRSSSDLLGRMRSSAGKLVLAAQSKVAALTKSATGKPPPQLRQVIKSNPVPAALGILVALVFLASALSKCISLPSRDPSAGSATDGRMRLAVEPPAPYFD